MRDLAILFIHLPVTIARLSGPGGARSVVAESLLVKHQLLIFNRSRVRAPGLRPTDRVIVGLCAILMRPTRLLRSAIVLKPSTILSFHRALVKRKYRLLFTPKTRGKPGPKGPSPELISTIIEMKRRNPNFGYQRIAEHISLVFDIEIDKDLVRRVLARHYRPEPGSNGPSWLTFLGHSKDSLWSVDLFRCESLSLKSHWVMVVMDQFTRRIIGFAVHAGVLDGPTVCRMFNSIIGGSKSPRYLSSDHDPLFRFHQWNANLRILELTQVKTVPYVPLSHPFVERLIGTIRREFLDQVPFWTARDLERKLLLFEGYYNRDRVHRGLGGLIPDPKPANTDQNIARLNNYRWNSCCRGLYQLPAAA
ncbi:MAG: transposase [Gammaproteobacteria bacterium]|nr:MAG: transposase [Gammaproteobacteria bacterium]